MEDKPERRPGENFINRYMPDASAEDRDRANVALDKFAHVAFRIAQRMTRKADSPESPSPGTIESVTEPPP